MASPRRGKGSGRFRFLLVLFILLVAAYLLRDWLLPPVGQFLSRSDPPGKADVIIVLAGDGSGLRISRGGELAQQGLAPKVLVSGPDGMYGGYECDFAIAYAVKKGFPESLFERVPHTGRSTKDEAAIFVQLMRNRGIKHYILVSTDFHTRRAGKLFQAAGPELQMTVIGAPDPKHPLATWWKDRETMKTVWTEYQKTITGPLGL